jgi:hypothetical protein
MPFAEYDIAVTFSGMKCILYIVIDPPPSGERSSGYESVSRLFVMGEYR